MQGHWHQETIQLRLAFSATASWATLQGRIEYSLSLGSRYIMHFKCRDAWKVMLGAGSPPVCTMNSTEGHQGERTWAPQS